MGVVGFVPGDGVGEAAGGGDVAVEEVDEGMAAFLAGEVGEEDGCYVAVCDPGVDGADTFTLLGFAFI